MYAPGAALSRAAGPIARNRDEGKFPYQWLNPGPNSKLALPSAIVSVPAIVSPAQSATASVLTYEVPQGYIYMLDRLLMATNCAQYSPGQQQLLFTLQALYATGPRQVEWLNNLDFPYGQFTTLPGDMRMVLQEIDRPLMFHPLDVLQITVLNNGINVPAATDKLIGALGGYLFPESEVR